MSTAVSKDIVGYFTKNVQKYYGGDEAKLRAIMKSNAIKMFLESTDDECDP